MTMTTIVVADSGDPPVSGGRAVDKPKKVSGAMRFVETRPGLGTGRTLLGGRVVSMGYVGGAGKGKEKRLAFNNGYDTDEGGGSRSHSKSVGSGRNTGKGGRPHGCDFRRFFQSLGFGPVHVLRLT